MSDISAEKLWEVAKLVKRGATFEEMPDGVDWDDLARAEAIAARVDFDPDKEAPDAG